MSDAPFPVNRPADPAAVPPQVARVIAFFEAIGGAGAPVTIFTFDADG